MVEFVKWRFRCQKITPVIFSGYDVKFWAIQKYKVFNRMGKRVISYVMIIKMQRVAKKKKTQMHIKTASKSEQPGLSSSIRSEVMYIRTQLAFMRLCLFSSPPLQQ